MQKIKVVSFDGGNILFTFDKMIACEKIASYARSDVGDVYRRLVGSTLERSLECGHISPDEFAQNVRERFGIDATHTNADIQNAWGDIVSTHEEIVPVIRELAGRVEFNVLSNTSMPHWRFIKRLEPLRRLELLRAGFTLSYLVGALKPERKMYDAVLTSTGVHPSEIIYFDDIPAYAEAARALSIQAYEYDCTRHPISRLIEILRNHGLLA